jgi:hypothetical protein
MAETTRELQWSLSFNIKDFSIQKLGYLRLMSLNRYMIWVQPWRGIWLTEILGEMRYDET